LAAPALVFRGCQSYVEAYSGMTVVEFTLSEWLEEWVPGLERAGLLIGLNWSGQGAVLDMNSHLPTCSGTSRRDVGWAIARDAGEGGRNGGLRGYERARVHPPLSHKAAHREPDLDCRNIYATLSLRERSDDSEPAERVLG